MPSLRRKIGSPFWFACFTLADGRRTQRSTKTRERKLAFKLASEWEDAAHRRITEAQARRVLSDIHEQIHGTRLDCPSVVDFAGQWLARKQGETAPVTIVAYRHATDDFISFLAERASQPIHYITPAQVAAWRDESAKRATPRTANNKLKVVRTLFQSAWRDGLITENPAAKVQSLKTPESLRRPFTLAEVKAILRVASFEWRGMILAGFYTGQRLKDIASLTWANIDLERREIRLVTSKTRRRQVIPIAKPLLAYFGELSVSDDPHSPLFPQVFPFSSRVGGSSVLSQQFYEILVSAGLARPRPPKRQPKGVGRDAAREQNEISFHSLRHTLTSGLKATGSSEAVARDIVGHESAEVSRHYTHTDDAAKRQAVDNLPDITIGP